MRFRLTLLYSMALFAASSIVVGLIYWGLARSLNAQIAADMAARESPTIAFGPEQDLLDDRREFELLVDQQTLDTLQTYSMVGLAALFVISLGVGWFTAGRVLTPIGRITRVARDIQATDLSRRIGLLGPNDDLKQLADTFDAMLDRLQRAFDNQQRLIHDTSHELRNPLAVMRTNLDVTVSDPGSTIDDYRHTVEVAQRSSERMSKLVDDLLAYARHEAATRVEAPVDVSRMVTNVSDEFAGPAEQSGLELALDIEPDLHVVGHARSLEQAVANLLANAVRFAPARSAISVTAGADGGWVWITVGDEGPGIAPENRERVFQRYVRAGEGEAGRPHLAGGEGSGLGLAIVREIVQAHRGEVSVLDTPVGAMIAMWFPRHVVEETTGEFRLRRSRRRQPTSV
ncbi:MAG: HAMP domain-containing sensor histidine kinase [Actinomycetota bacterium]